MSGPEKIADVEFHVYFDGSHWVAEVWSSARLPEVSECSEGHGTTPITALMVAEALARKAG